MRKLGRSQQLLMIMQQDAIPIQYRRADIPDRLAEIIEKSLSRNPDERFPDVTEFRKALLPFCEAG